MILFKWQVNSILLSSRNLPVFSPVVVGQQYSHSTASDGVQCWSCQPSSDGVGSERLGMDFYLSGLSELR